jgi:hypothetical protein
MYELGNIVRKNFYFLLKKVLTNIKICVIIYIEVKQNLKNKLATLKVAERGLKWKKL